MRANYSKFCPKVAILIFFIGVIARCASAQSLPVGWSDQDIGQVGLTGSATYSNGMFTVAGAGGGIGGTADGFNFAYLPLSGDGTIVARVANIQGSGEAGVIIRETLNAGATSNFVYYWSAQGDAYLCYRTTTGGSTSCSGTTDYGPVYPYWVKVTRNGNTLTGYFSSDGVNWWPAGTSQTVSMAQNIYLGLAASSQSTGSLITVSFDNVSVNSTASPGPSITSVSATTGSVGSQIVIGGAGFGASQGTSAVNLNGAPVTINSWSDSSITFTVPSGATTGLLEVCVAPSMNDSNPVVFEVTAQPLPATWLDQDVGKPWGVGLSGSTTYSNGTFTIKAAGTGISNTADGMHFVYQPLSGDGTIVARVTGIQGGSNPEVGVMIRETLNAGASSTFAYFWSVAADSYFCYRSATGGNTTCSPTRDTGPAYPYWVKIIRSGNTFTGYFSSDGLNWGSAGTSQTITMAQNVYVGLAASAESTTSLATVTLDSVSINSVASPAPVISSMSATTGPVGSQVVISGAYFGTSQGNSVVYLNGTAATINSWSDTSITFTVPSGASTGILVVSVAPTMNDSNPVIFEVTNQPLPGTWLDQDVGDPGQVGLGGSVTYSGGAFTLKAAGVGIGWAADAFHFTFQPLSGDGSIIARVANVQPNYRAGVMIRESLNPAAASTFVYFYPSLSYFCYRSSTGGNTSCPSSWLGINGYYPYWVKLARAGNTFTAYSSTNGRDWTQIGTSQTITMAQNVYIGLAATSGSATTFASDTFDSVSISSNLLVPPVITSVSTTTANIGSQFTIYGSSFGSSQASSVVVLNGSPVTINSWNSTAITATISSGATSGFLEVLQGASLNSSNAISFGVTSQPLPTGWLNIDVGGTILIGSATYSNGTFTINGAGPGVTATGTADGTQFVYQPLVGDGVIIARMDSAPSGGGAAGLMIRETMDAGARTVANYYNRGTSYFDVQARSTPGGSASSQQGNVYVSAFPYWMKLARTGNTLTAYASSDGVNWTQIGNSQTVTMAQSVYIGLLAISGTTSSLGMATFDNASFSTGTMPMISGVTPSSGGIGTQVTVTGSNFGSSQGTSTVNFNGAPATSVATWTNNQIVANVPSTGSSGPVTVVVNSIQSNTNFGFTLYNPIITSLTPSTAQVGATVTIAGSGFGANQGTSQVFFNGTPVNTVFSWSNTMLSVAVPTNATTGPVTVVVGGVTSSGVQLYVEPLSVTGISPNTGPAGTAVTITGTGFGATQSNGTVDFFGTTAVIQSWSDTQIIAVVPAGAPSGSVDVTVGSVVWYGPQYTMTQTLQLSDSKNNQSSYTSALVGGIWVPLVGQGSGCSTCTQRGDINYTYDTNGHALSRTDENGNTTTYIYDSSGNVLSITVPVASGHTATTTYTYNSFGEVLTVTDPMGFVTSNTYDTKGNLLSVTTPAPGNGASASVTQFAYNSLGELTKITDPRSNSTSLTYTSAGLIQTITDAQSNVTTYGYDSKGNRTSVTDANNKQTTFTYDAMNRLTLITYPDSTTTQFGYDYRGRRTSVTDQNGKAITYAYDDADRLITVTDAANNVTTYGYDTESNLTSIKDANNNTTYFAYDAFGRVTQTTFPSGYIETYGYDNVGNLTSKTDRKNQLLTYTYDQLNRLTKKSYPDTSTVNYAYDDDSRLTQVTDPTGTYQFTFDNMGRLTGTSTQYAFLTSRTFTTSYGYDAASNRIGFTDPENGSTSYAYDTLNRLQTLTPPAVIGGGSFGFGYDVLSRRTSLTRPNAVSTSYSYDNLSRLLSVTHAKGGVTLDGASYGLDNAGNRTAKTDLYANLTTNYGYDNVYELLSAAQGSTTTESYTYDPVGNRLTSLAGSWSNNTSNELTASPTASYTYDANGNTTSKTDSTGTTNYSWDYDNRLTQVTLPGSGGTVSYRYDPFGRRIYKSSSSGTSIYAYDGFNLTEEVNSTGIAVARYSQTQNVDEPLIMSRSGATSYYEADGLSSITSLTNATGALAQTYTYDSFGNQTAFSGSLTNPFRYTGREFDSESSLYYMRARYFDPSTGRFLSEDPLEFLGEKNFYRYALNNPVNYVDPSGLNTTVVIIYDKGPFGTSFGSHAALLIDNGMGGKPFLYDPAGSYSHDVCKSPHGDCSAADEGGNDANVKKFIEFHQADPSYYGYKLFIFSTTPEQESHIMDQINSLPNIMGGFCSSAVSDAISGIGPFKNLTPSLTPGGLADGLQNIISPLRPKGGHK